MAWTTPRTWVSGETVTAALLNTHLRDNLAALGDPWGAYTPTWSSTSGGTSLGNGTLAGFYIKTGKRVHLQISLTIGSTSVAGAGTFTFALPVVAVREQALSGGGRLFDTSASTQNAASAFIPAANLSTIRVMHPTGSVLDTAPWTWATDDTILIAGAYEAA